MDVSGLSPLTTGQTYQALQQQSAQAANVAAQQQQTTTEQLVAAAQGTPVPGIGANLDLSV
jgi:hypothetical protein